MNKDRYYLSDRDLSDRLDEMPGNDESDCGWGFDGPCGGCARCITAQQQHYFYKEREQARMFQRAGFEYVDSRVIDMDFFEVDKHDSYDCSRLEEIESYEFPWLIGE
ncbi:MAG: hypothetical protein ACRCUC_00270 [Aestuariivirga sp.]